MPTVRELTALYETFMVSPQPGPGVCRTCLTFTEAADGRPFSHCYPCANTQPWLDAVAPISYSVAGGQLHHVLVSYKRLTGRIARKLQTDLAAVLWRFLETHEQCLCAPLGLNLFPLVTTVPSGARGTDDPRPLGNIVGTLCGHTNERYEPLLERAETPAADHEFDGHRFEALKALPHQPVLLIDDTWTTGASAQSAAAALKRAGASHVAAVVIGRHLKREWRDNRARLDRLPHTFNWDRCVYCPESASLASARL